MQRMPPQLPKLKRLDRPPTSHAALRAHLHHHALQDGCSRLPHGHRDVTVLLRPHRGLDPLRQLRRAAVAGHKHRHLPGAGGGRLEGAAQAAITCSQAGAVTPGTRSLAGLPRVVLRLRGRRGPNSSLLPTP